MKFIFLSARQYEADFRRFLIEALRASGHDAWHVKIGRCNTLTGVGELQEFVGIVGLLEVIRRLRVIGADGRDDNIVYVDSTGAATPVRSILFRWTLLSGIWCFDIFDKLTYDYFGLKCSRHEYSSAC